MNQKNSGVYLHGSKITGNMDNVSYVLVAQLSLTLCDPKNCSPPGSSVHGIFRLEYWSG